jgi:hypothetical protein
LLLQNSPHHLLKPYGSFAEAVQAPDLAAYIHDLRENYPPHAARQLLAAMPQDGSATGDSGKSTSSSRRRAAAAAKGSAALDSTQPPPPPEPPIYRLRDIEPPRDSDLAATLPPRKVPVPRSAQPSPRAKASVHAASPGPKARPLPPEPVLVSPDALHPPADEPSLPNGSWFSALLFGVVTTAALAWLAYTLCRPFLP